ncbi:MAG: phage holin family protein [Bacteroides sp.]|nr:phage holin family protein [Bacteroides sp.]MCM1414201.1 phage holin family protein [Bacteroides sp.]MCM1472023.1 phage holin family protein [Bacteroides sp.]
MLSLKYEYVKLTLAEKLTLLFAAIAICIIVFVSLSAILFFLSVALEHLLAESVGNVWSSVIVAGVYLALVVVVLLLRKPLIINPISRFVSKLLMH